MQEERIPLNTESDSESDLEKSSEFNYRNLISAENDNIECIVCFKTEDEIDEKYGCIQCAQCRLCKDCALNIMTRTKNKKVKNKCPVCSKPKKWCKNITTNELLIPMQTQNNDIENPTTIIIERRGLRRNRNSYDDLKVICRILCCMVVLFLFYMFYINNDSILH